ncbi:serine/threonine protein kinase [Rivularia sp. PCC 7116]|uniref:serine/threonine protein kinase n=1 Tax=Rivularia sp. PCC 7116 TaxID=373994 RepID=UPI00029F3BF4|nr:serine/threonine-protein kinase [Rivularia sp. PCC 7116]AFY52911.1 serine/threonine protein kinase [Rivularia sp. PCC 7116]
MTNQILQERYYIQKQLGKNSGRKTLLVKDLETQELVVVKLLNFDIDFDWQDLKLFEREAQILQELSHPAIPKYLDSFKVDSDNSKGFGLVQTYIPAKSLEEHIQSGRTFSEAEVKQIATALLEVLTYLHSRQPAVIHRDIKPSNILLGDRTGNHVGEVYLVDFGAVKTTAVQQDGTMTVVGTYGYMAQEQFGGRAVPTSDLYSLGATLIYLVTGSHPADLLGDDMVIKFEETVNLSAEFVSWLKWMTQTTLKKRPSSTEAALQELENPTVSESKIVLKKPHGSEVQLTKKKSELEILIPPYGFNLLILVSCLFPVVWLNILFNIPFGITKLLFIIFAIPIFTSLIFSSLFQTFGYIIFHISQDKVKLFYQIFGIPFRIKPISSRSDINKLEVVGRTIDKTVKGNPEIPPKLIVWAGKNKYELGKIASSATIDNSSSRKEYLTAPEIDWLAQELSDFLDLPIARD